MPPIHVQVQSDKHNLDERLQSVVVFGSRDLDTDRPIPESGVSADFVFFRSCQDEQLLMLCGAIFDDLLREHPAEEVIRLIVMVMAESTARARAHQGQVVQ